MSLGFHNTQFPNVVTLDKLDDYYNTSYHYNTATTASLSVSQSFTPNTTIDKTSGTATSALASNGNLAFCFEGTGTLTIIEGLGGTSTSLSLGATTAWRGMVYEPINDKFIIFGTGVIKLINATSPHTLTTVSSTFGATSQVWGGVVVEGKVYYAPFVGSSQQIAVLDVESGTTALTGNDWGYGQSQFMAGCITRDATMIWGGESDSTIKEWDFATETLITIPSSIQYSGYQGWAPLSNGKLFNAGWNSSNFQVYTPKSENGGEVGKIDIYSKTDSNLGPWSNVFPGLDGRAYYVDSKGVSQLGDIYSDVFVYDPIQNHFIKTQFKMPAYSTSGDRQNQAIIVQEDGWVVSAGNFPESQNYYYAVKMFEPNNTITNGSRTAGFVPNTSN